MSRSLLLVSRDGEGFYDEMRVMYEDSPPARVILDRRSMLILAAASRNLPHVILLDLRLPRIDGPPAISEHSMEHFVWS